MNRRPSIVVVGSTMIDLVAYADPLPGPGETLEGREFALGFGGKGANQAAMAALLGAEVAFVNRVGDDLFGGMVLEDLGGSGVDVARVRRVEGLPTGVASIWVEGDGTNRIVIVPGANREVTATAVAGDLAELAGAGCVVCQLEIPVDGVVAALDLGRRWGAVTILNPAPAAALDHSVLELVDWLIPNETEFATLFGAPPEGELLLEAAASTGAGLVVTLGERGSVVVSGGVVHHVPALAVDAVDTTGAGDAFVGGFASALASGSPVEDAVRTGTVCGALSATRPGARASFPSRAAVLAALEAAAPADAKPD